MEKKKKIFQQTKENATIRINYVRIKKVPDYVGEGGKRTGKKRKMGGRKEGRKGIKRKKVIKNHFSNNEFFFFF